MNKILRLHKDKKFNEMANLVIASLSKLDGLVGIFTYGSTSYGGRDRFSDIDVGIVVRGKDKLRKELPVIIRRTVKTIFLFEPRFSEFMEDLYLFYFEGGYKFDVVVYEKSDSLLVENLNETKIIIDRQGHLINIIREKPRSKIDQSLKERYLALALADIFAVAREVYRKDIFEARFNLDEARNCITTYINLSNQYDCFHPDRFHEYIHPEILQEIRQSLLQNDTLSGITRGATKLLHSLELLAPFHLEAFTEARKRLEIV